MAKIRRIRLKSKKFEPVIGLSPGAVQLYNDALKPVITLHIYNSEEYQTIIIISTADLDRHLSEYSGMKLWIEVRGIGDSELLSYLQNKFSLDKLLVEDIAESRQRPKLDEYGDYLFSVSRMLYINKDLEIENEQFSIILFPEILISFQDSYTDVMEPVINRLKEGKGNIRSGGAAYLLYALSDVIIDNYFSLIYKLGDELETIEDLLYKRPDKTLMFQIQNIKREMILIRRCAWPERDKINDLLRTESKLLNKLSKAFLKDTYDHCMQVIDLVEGYKDLTTSLIDLNLSLISNKMNEIMKVLTIISSIFIPLTFIAGIYGMNFAFEDPETGKILRNNMPELYSENGYVYTMGVMLLIALVQLIYFWQKGWFRRN